MGSNSRKKTDKTGHFFKKRKRQSRFRTTLFLQPLTILVTAFAIIMLIFNGLLKLFLAEEAFRAVQSQYDILDARYVGNDSSKILDGNIFETTYAIVDEDFSIKYISASTYDLSEKQISEKVVDYFSDKTETDWFDEELDTDSQQFKKLKVYDSTYMVKMQEYSGTLGEGYVKQTNNDQNSQNYYVFVFANVTPIADFERYINYLLLSLMVIVGLVAIITIFLTSRKLDKHFGALKSYILRVGNRERDLQPENFAYREFNEVGQTVDRMNDMIDANQRSQQLFFQNSSHELRTPLMSIQGYAEAIQEGVAADDKEAAAVILDESRKMA
ncbi:histidine kinase dimerization/phospho-acceptor domain-containing protein, partial [uncultured Streptococcus sp.]|uniref:histidine kinase dimerization/phospho-acceptor domain-containing protein n=1 Tax=uncultured Streptococcus sp. TaxID=83427 RepID=UPI002590245B